jgi:hypothetical protein
VANNKINIQVKDLNNVKQGKGYIVGNLKEDHETFSYLRKDVLVFVTESIQTVFRAINDLKWKPERAKSSDKRGNDDFNKFASLEEAVSTYTLNPRSIRTFKEEDIKLTSEETIGKDVLYDVSGDYVDIGRYLDGEPECFGVSYNGNPSNLHATIMFNVSTPWFVNEEMLNHRAARMLRLVDWMESQGVRCQIRAFESTECAHMDIKVKNFEDPVDMNALAVSTHSDFLRRISFLVAEQSAKWDHGYGNATIFTSKMMNSYKAEPDNGLTIFITELGQVDAEYIDTHFDKLRDKVTALINGEEERDFTKIYSVNLKG